MKWSNYERVPKVTLSPLKFIDENAFFLGNQDRVIGFFLYDTYNKEVAKVKGLMVDMDHHRPQYLVIELGGFLSTEGKTILFPKDLYQPAGLGKVVTEWTRESIQQAPSVETTETLFREEEQIILSYFDLKPYWETDPEKEKPKLQKNKDELENDLEGYKQKMVTDTFGKTWKDTGREIPDLTLDQNPPSLPNK